jgi:hypothetical protein
MFRFLIHHVAAIPPKVEEAFKSYRYVPYTALMHAARSKAHLRGEDSSFIFTQDGLTAKGLDRSSELLILTVDWIGAARAAEERTLHYWGVGLVSCHALRRATARIGSREPRAQPGRPRRSSPYDSQ